VQKTKFLQL